MVGRRVAGPLATVVLDAGGVLAYIGPARAVRDYCHAVLAGGQQLVLPTVVYAQIERGLPPRSLGAHFLTELLDICTLATLELPIARQAGWLLRDSQTTDVVDAVVVAEAVARGSATIMTSDRGDIDYLLGFTANRSRRGVRVVGA